ncbi:cytochrome P450 [Streptomyces sp. NPDC001941]|uniref:cytochrome P450 n=1 Tax=Streptomyces sp. NPDC001941 TaxID=3154659 RepID=UPI0033305F93
MELPETGPGATALTGPDLAAPDAAPDPSDLDLTDLDLFAHGTPHAAFRALRDRAPVFWNEEADGNKGFWSVTRYDDVAAVDRDAETWSSEQQVTLEELDEEQLLVRKSMIDTDGARHWALRKLLVREFSPRAVARYGDFLKQLTGATLDRALALGEFDFVEQISADIPIRLLARMLDVPVEDTDKLIDWGNQMIANSDPDYTDVLAGSAESEEYRHLPFRSPAALEVFEYGFRLAAQRKGGAGSDLVSKLVNTLPEDGVPLTDLDFQNYFSLLIIAGNETTRHTISHTVRALASHPRAWADLKADPSLVQNAVEEFLRWSTPILHFRRTATRDVELHGQRIREGDKVVMWFGSANFDERKFEDPYVFDVRRKNVEHVSFGKGSPHFCLGNALARLEIRIVITALLERLERIELLAEPSMVRSNLVHGIKRMPVRVHLDPARSGS